MFSNFEFKNIVNPGEDAPVLELLSISNFELNIVCAKNGEPTGFAKDSNGQDAFFHSNYAPSSESQKRISQLSFVKGEDVVLLGLGLGYDLKAIINAVDSTSNIYVVEGSRKIYDSYCQNYISKELQKCDNITYLINKSFLQLQDFFSSLTKSPKVVVKNSATLRFFPQYYNNLPINKENRKQTFNMVFFVGKGIVAPFILQDFAVAFSKLGVNVKLVPLMKEPGKIVDEIKSFKPDFLFTLDYAGYDLPWINELGVKKVTWFVDNPFYFLSSLNKEDIIFCWDRAYVGDLKKIGFKSVYFLPLATNPDKFNPLVNSEDKENFLYDVSFVGSVGKSYLKERLDRNVMVQNLCGVEFQSGFDEFMQKKQESFINGTKFDDTLWIKSVLNKEPKAKQLFIERQLDYEFCSFLREIVIRELCNYKSVFYGNDVISEMVSDVNLYKGGIDYNTELPVLYNSTKININVSRPQLKTTVNQRVFDIAATGSFFITDYRDYLMELFDFDVSDIVFRSIPEMNDKLKYYLNNEKEREQLASKMQKSVLAEHTYLHRAREVESILYNF